MKLQIALLMCLSGAFNHAQIWYPETITQVDFQLKGPVKSFILDDNCEPALEFGIYSRIGCYYEVYFNKKGYVNSIKSRHATNRAETNLTCTYLHDTLLASIRGNWYPTEFDFRYNEQLKILEIDETINGKIEEKFRFYYDTVSNTLTTTRAYQGEKRDYIHERLLYCYNNLGLLVRISALDKKHHPIETKSFEYDIENRVTSKCVWTQMPKNKNEFTTSIEYVWTYFIYDSIGQILEENTFLYADKKPCSARKYLYNQVGQLIKISDTDYIRNSGYITEIEYDSLGQKKLKTNYARNTMYSYTIYLYDEQGNLQQEIIEERIMELDESQKRHVFKWKITEHNIYAYDSHGNWISHSYLDWDGTQKNANRTITYWE